MKKLYQTICSTTVLPYQQQTEVLLTLLPSTLVLTKNNFQAISCYLWWQIDESNQDRNCSICFWDSSYDVPSHTCFDIIIVSLQKLKVLAKASSFTVTQRFPEVSVFITSKDSLDSFGLKSPEPSWVPGRSLGRYCFSLWWLATGLLRRDTPVRASLPLL